MKINWKARFKNKAFIITFVTLVVAFVYQVLCLFDVVPSVSEDSIVNIITMLVNILAFVGVIVDPTTEGLKDSDRAMLYYTDYDERMLDE
jgi:phi LC3 family holin